MKNMSLFRRLLLHTNKSASWLRPLFAQNAANIHRNKKMRGGGNRGKDFYGVLGLEKGANESEIKKAYRKLAMKWHPVRTRRLSLPHPSFPNNHDKRPFLFFPFFRGRED